MSHIRSSSGWHPALLALTSLGLCATGVVAGNVDTAVAATDDARVVVTDEADDVDTDGEENPALVSATDVSKVVYRVGEASNHDGDRAVKIRIFHAETLSDGEHRHRGVTTFTHDDRDYRLVHDLDSATLLVLKGDAWKQLHPEWISANGADGQLAVTFPVAALGRAFTMQELRTRLVVSGTSIVDRTRTDDELPVYPPR
jgi:hypothetical protein